MEPGVVGLGDACNLCKRIKSAGINVTGLCDDDLRAISGAYFRTEVICGHAPLPVHIDTDQLVLAETEIAQACKDGRVGLCSEEYFYLRRAEHAIAFEIIACPAQNL